MKLSEITKKEFLNTLKNPEHANIRKAIKEFREYLNQWGWKVTSRYDKHQNVFRVYVRDDTHLIDLISGRPIATTTQVYGSVAEFFPPSRYRIDIHQKSVDNIVFWITTEPQT